MIILLQNNNKWSVVILLEDCYMLTYKSWVCCCIGVTSISWWTVLQNYWWVEAFWFSLVKYEWGKRGSAILEDGWELPNDWPPFLKFSAPVGSLLYVQFDLITPTFCRKISLTQSHNVRGIIGCKVGLFH